MKNLKDTTENIIKIDSVVCNMCGHTIENDSFGYLDNYISIEKRWGYGSKFDNEVHSFELCEGCYTKLINMLQIPPK